MRHAPTALRLLAVSTLLLVTATETPAQACVGVPSRGGQFAFQAGADLTADATGYGAAVTANLRGPLSVSAGYAVTNLHDLDPHLRTFSGDVAFEIGGTALSVCPTASVGYSRVSGLSTGIYPGPYTTVTTVAWSFDVAVGRTLRISPAVSATPFGAAGFVLLHDVAQAENEGFRTPEYPDNDSGFGAVLGCLIGTQRVHAGGSVTVTTIKDADPVVTIGIGVVW